VGETIFDRNPSRLRVFTISNLLLPVKSIYLRPVASRAVAGPRLAAGSTPQTSPELSEARGRVKQ